MRNLPGNWGAREGEPHERRPKATGLTHVNVHPQGAGRDGFGRLGSGQRRLCVHAARFGHVVHPHVHPIPLTLARGERILRWKHADYTPFPNRTFGVESLTRWVYFKRLFACFTPHILPSAIELAHAALEMSLELYDPDLTTRSNMILGLSYYFNGFHSISNDYYQAALDSPSMPPDSRPTNIGNCGRNRHGHPNRHCSAVIGPLATM